VFGNERIAILGKLIQDRQVFMGPYIPQGDTDVPDEALPFDAFNRRIAEKATKLSVCENCQLP
jgi:hypothetical protein